MALEGLGTTASLLRMSKDDLWNMACRQFFNPTAAFPAILDNTIRKAIVQRYQAVPTTFQVWTTKGSVTDFKPTKDHEYLAGGAGEFLRVGEGGELKHDTPQTELLPQRQVATYGRQFSMTREAFINDDVGFITQVPGMYAASAKRTINKQVYSILFNNPTIFDGVALFHANHNNLITTGAAPSIETLQAIMIKLLNQKDPFGDSIMVQPRYIIVPVGYGFLMSQILETAQIDVDGIGSHTANALYQYRNRLQVIEEGTLNALAGSNAVPWFVAGDPTYARSIQVDYLNGQETPTIRRMEVAGQLGYVWDIWLDWGITAVDFRGIAKNPTDDLANGDVVDLATRIGVAGNDIPAGETGAVHVVGVFEIPKATGAVTVGQALYWDKAAENITTAAGSSPANTPAGWAVAAAGSSDATVLVKLLG